MSASIKELSLKIEQLQSIRVDLMPSEMGRLNNLITDIKAEAKNKWKDQEEVFKGKGDQLCMTIS